MLATRVGTARAGAGAIGLRLGLRIEIVIYLLSKNSGPFTPKTDQPT